jgi:hypothetical protein
VTKYRGTATAYVTGVDNIRLEIYRNGPVAAGFDVCQTFYDFFDNPNNAGKVYTSSCTSSAADYLGGHAVSMIG